MFDLQRLLEIRNGPLSAALCTIAQTRGSTPRKCGSSMVVIADGSAHGLIEGTIGGGAVEHRVREEALACILARTPRALEVALTSDLGMCCGGSVVVLIEPLNTALSLLIFGAGHVSESVCHIAAHAGFEVIVADPRPEYCTAARFPKARRLLDDYEEDDLDTLPFGPHVFAFVATHDHQIDQQLVERLLARETAYLSLIGSLRKAKMTRDRCVAHGIPADRVAHLICPAGLDIHAETPEEIAVSVVAQMVQHRRQKVPTIAATASAATTANTA